MTCSSICDLEFVLLLWSTFCPDYGERAPLIHWRAQTSNSLDFRSDGPRLEICQMFQPFTGQVMNDTMMPPDGIHTVPDVHLETTPADIEANQGGAAVLESDRCPRAADPEPVCVRR
jgi:hypothetical protein